MPHMQCADRSLNRIGKGDASSCQETVVYYLCGLMLRRGVATHPIIPQFSNFQQKISHRPSWGKGLGQMMAVSEYWQTIWQNHF